MNTLLERLQLAAHTGTYFEISSEHADLIITLLDEIDSQNRKGRLGDVEKLVTTAHRLRNAK